MAIIKLGAMVVGIRGTVGGVTFSANKSGPHAQIWSKGSNPKSPLQTAQRARLASIPEAWRATSAAEKTAWDTFAALPAQALINSLGETYSISGFGWYNKINIRLLAMGRAIRDAVPTQSRPSAPTISDVEFPYGDAMTAFVEYPSAEFDPDFDLVLEVAQAGSTGRASPPSSFAEFLVLQNPNDTEAGFMAAYVNRLGIGNASLKGFIRMYRQTTDGLRSAASAASFVESDATDYVATAKDYDGATNYSLRGSDLTGNADTAVGTLSFWFKVDGGDATSRYVMHSGNGFFACYIQSNNTIRFVAYNTAAQNTVDFRTTTTFAVGATWHHFMLGFDNDAGEVFCTVDGVAETLTEFFNQPGTDIDWTRTDWSIGAVGNGSAFYDGCLSELYFSTDKYLNPQDPAVLESFLSREGYPQYLGSEGQLPTNSVPIIYTQAVDPAVNLGSGGNFVNQAALSACSDAP